MRATEHRHCARVARRCAAGLVCLFTAFAAGAACHVSGANLAFGPYDPLGGGGASTSGSVTVHCSDYPAARVRVHVTPSAVSGRFAPREMRRIGSDERLVYNLYADPGATWVWGDGSGGTMTLTESVDSHRPWRITLYGRIPPGQDVTPGDYFDSVGIAVDF